jgi:FkbM family methyltransferase
MRIPERFNKPEYLFQPARLMRRIRGVAGDPAKPVRLPWGHALRIHPGDGISNAILASGVYDLALSEAIWRLLDPGERALDAGANLGYVTSLMAARTGPRGHVDSFEPHPALFQELSDNAAPWDRVRLHRTALSDRRGRAFLKVPDYFEVNRGTASVNFQGEGCEVTLETLDDLFAGDRFDVVKIDVEGHEAAVLAGARRMLERHAIRDIVFEDFNPFPSAAMAMVTGSGYTLFRIEKNLLGPALCDPASAVKTQWSAVNYLATVDPERALTRMRARGWSVLRYTPSE